MNQWKESYHPYAMTTIIFWSMAYVLTRIALQHFSAFPLGFLRYFIASFSLLVFAVSTKMRPPEKSDLKWFFVSGAVGFFLYMLSFNKGCETVTASTSSIIIATVPVITALLARYIHGEMLNHCQWAAILMEFAGVVLLTLMNGVFSVNKGIFWLLLAAVSLSTYNLLQRKLTKAYTALQSTAFSIFFGTLMLSIFAPAGAAELHDAPAKAMISLAILGVFSSAAAYMSWAKALAKAKRASSVSNYMFLTPFLASIMGFVLVGEKPDMGTFAGGGIIFAGMAVYYYGNGIVLLKSAKK